MGYRHVFSVAKLRTDGERIEKRRLLFFSKANKQPQFRDRSTRGQVSESFDHNAVARLVDDIGPRDGAYTDAWERSRPNRLARCQ